MLVYTVHKVGQCWLILKSQGGSVLADTEITRWVSAGLYWSQGGSVLVYTGHKVGQCWFLLVTSWVGAGLYWSQGGSVLVYTGHKVGQCWLMHLFLGCLKSQQHIQCVT